MLSEYQNENITEGVVQICLDKFRGSIAASEACAAVAEGILSVLPECPVARMPVADGGEGTVDIMVAAGYERVNLEIKGPDGSLRSASIAVRSGRAVIEVAQAVGYSVNRAIALMASSFGVGQMIKAALDIGCRELILALGGSSTSDGGSGMLEALGARFTDISGRPITPGGVGLNRLWYADLSGMDMRLKESSIVIACDVFNPLLGPSGTVAVYGPQKGVKASEIGILESGLSQFVRVLEGNLGVRMDNQPGAGAAGGIGYAAMILGGRTCSGIGFVLEETGAAARIPSSRLVIVGEGMIDDQSLRGKASVGVATMAARYNIPVVAVAGRITINDAALAELGIVGSYAIVDRARNLKQSIRNAYSFLWDIGAVIAMTYLIKKNGHCNGEIVSERVYGGHEKGLGAACGDLEQ